MRELSHSFFFISDSMKTFISFLQKKPKREKKEKKKKDKELKPKKLDPAIKADSVKKERKVTAKEQAADCGKGEETGPAVEGGVAASGTLAKVG